MPIIGSFGAGSGKGFGFGGETGPEFIIATGGTVTNCGDYKIHTFTSDGTFSVTNKGKPTGSNSVDYLVVAGGGGVAGSPDVGAGGGGAGGFRVSILNFLQLLLLSFSKLSFNTNYNRCLSNYSRWVELVESSASDSW
jgi:hypothetical protein